MDPIRAEYFKEMNNIIKSIKQDVFDYITGIYDELLQKIENLFGEKLEQYIMIVYELDELIDNCNYNISKLKEIENIISKVNETRDSLKESLLDIEILFLNNSIDTYKKGVKRIMEKEIISKFSNGPTKNLLRTCIKEEVIKSQNILKEYYKDQQENLNKYYELFVHQENIINEYYSKVERKERLDNMYIKRFTCTYYQMENFLKNKGYEKIRQNGTSHAIYRNKKGHSLPLPNKRGEMCPSTISLILNQCNSNRNELGKFIKSL